jgi:hypothetical protein
MIYNINKNDLEANMKKLVSLLLLLVFAFSTVSMVSCTADDLTKLNGKKPEQLYKEVLKGIRDAEEYEVTSEQIITITANDGSMEISNTLIQMSDGENVYFKSDSKMLGREMVNELTWVDGVLYYSDGDDKYCTELSQKDVKKFFKSDLKKSALLDIPDEWLKGLEFQVDGDYFCLKFTVSSDDYSSLLEGTDLEDMDIGGDVNVTLYFTEEGNLDKMVATFEVTVAGIKANCVSTSLISLKDVTVSAPSDADTYEKR